MGDNSLFYFFSGKFFKYIDSKWQEVSREDCFKITKIEGQVSKNIDSNVKPNKSSLLPDINYFLKDLLLFTQKIILFINDR